MIAPKSCIGCVSARLRDHGPTTCGLKDGKEIPGLSRMGFEPPPTWCPIQGEGVTFRAPEACPSCVGFLVMPKGNKPGRCKMEHESGGAFRLLPLSSAYGKGIPPQWCPAKDGLLIRLAPPQRPATTDAAVPSMAIASTAASSLESADIEWSGQ